MDNKEYFVGNTDIKDKIFKIFDSLGIKYRFGDVTKDIDEKVIKDDGYKPLYIIGESSYKKYDDFMMEELRKINKKYGY